MSTGLFGNVIWEPVSIEYLGRELLHPSLSFFFPACVVGVVFFPSVLTILLEEVIDSPLLCIVSVWELFNHYPRIFSFRLGALAGSGSQLMSSAVRISGCFVWCFVWGAVLCGVFVGLFVLLYFFCLCNIIVGTGILEGLWLAVNEIHKVRTWEERVINSLNLSLSFGRGSFGERMNWLRIAMSTPL